MVSGERSSVTSCKSGVPQCSILGPLLFSVYVSPVDSTISAHGLSYQQYADDLQLYVTITPGSTTELTSLEQCVNEVSWWFLRNGLLFNPAKTEAVVFGTRQRLVRSRDRPRSVNVSGVQVTESDSVKLLSVILDSALTQINM